MKHVSKPCHILGYCPYGPLVEDMPLRPLTHIPLKIYPEISCEIFGHDCPVYLVAEDVRDTKIDPPVMRIWTEERSKGLIAICKRKMV